MSGVRSGTWRQRRDNSPLENKHALHVRKLEQWGALTISVCLISREPAARVTITPTMEDGVRAISAKGLIYAATRMASVPVGADLSGRRSMFYTYAHRRGSTAARQL